MMMDLERWNWMSKMKNVKNVTMGKKEVIVVKRNMKAVKVMKAERTWVMMMIRRIIVKKVTMTNTTTDVKETNAVTDVKETRAIKRNTKVVKIDNSGHNDDKEECSDDDVEEEEAEIKIGERDEHEEHCGRSNDNKEGEEQDHQRPRN